MKKVCTLSIAALIAMNAWDSSVYAQNIISFDDVEINDSFMSISKSIAVDETDEDYDFTSNGVRFEGTQHSWGNFSGFDCSRGTDTTDGTYSNDISAITGGGHNGTAQYLVAYLSADWPDNPNQTLPLGVKIADSASVIESAAFTNTTLTYQYIQDNWENLSFYGLIIKGYAAGVASEDSIYITLAEKSEAEEFALKNWEEVDMTALGAVDSITFELITDDANGYLPFYFAMDELIFKAQENTSVSSPNWLSQLVVYPNPADNFLYVQTENVTSLSYTIYNIQGQLIHSGIYQNGIDISSLAVGNYLLQLNQDQEAKNSFIPFVKN